MSSVNKVIIVGNVGRDPETKYLPNGDCVCNISIATTESWKDKNSGEKKEATEWHRIVLYRRLGEIAAEYLAKGSQVYIEGSLKTRKYTDKDGVERYTTEIIASDMKMLGSKQSGGRSDDDGYGAPAPARGNNRNQQQGRPQGGQQRQQQRPAPSYGDMDDDIPFMNPYFGKICLAV